MQNSAAIASLTAAFAAAMGIVAPTVPTGGFGPFGVSVPAISSPASASTIARGSVVGLTSSLPSLIASEAVNEAITGVARPPEPSHGAATPSESEPVSNLQTVTGQTTTSRTSTLQPGGLSGILGNLKKTDWSGFPRAPGHGGGGGGTHITGVHWMAGAGLFMGGTALAVGEKIFGVKSLEQTAHDDIKAAYGIEIPTNSGTIKQVVAIAKEQYGGSISVAVRSPSVRQLVMLYSEATGQKIPMSATTPYAGSLVEQGGRLYQQASFQNNAWHTYASTIPTLAGIAGSPYPTPGNPNAFGGAGPTYISLNIGGADAARFMTGQFVTPEFVTDQSMIAQNSSYGRMQQSANLQLPGLTVA